MRQRGNEDLKRLVVVGAGNIGSHLIPHLGRMDDVGRVTIIDRDTYDATNLSGQDILPGDVGHPKAMIQARRLRKINPRLSVTAIHDDVERLPPGLLLGEAILAGVDNRRARQHLNDVAWQLGVPWIDAAVDGAGWLARLGVYQPGEDRACLECGWNSSDYDALEQIHPCTADRGPETASAPPTGAPSALGAVVAGLQALECRSLLTPGSEARSSGRQLFFDLRHHQYYSTVLGRNPGCRRFEHEAWNPVPLDLDLRTIRIGDLLAGRDLARPDAIAFGEPCELRVNNLRWVRQLVCRGCGASRTVLRVLRGSVLQLSQACSRCGDRMQPRGLDMTTIVGAGMLTRAQKRQSLHAAGVRPHDILTLLHSDGSLFRGRITGDRS